MEKQLLYLKSANQGMVELLAAYVSIFSSDKIEIDVDDSKLIYRALQDFNPNAMFLPMQSCLSKKELLMTYGSVKMLLAHCFDPYFYKIPV